METSTHYSVFLNHRGPDLKQTFVSHLFDALHNAGCVPFLDKESLVKGHDAFMSIDNALHRASVHVAIFSQGYAESMYCLNELCDMLQSKKPLIPVFYDVEPMHLRCIDRGPFAKAFYQHAKKGWDEDVRRWQRALGQAAAITGFMLSEVNGNTAKLVKKIVKRVLNELPMPLLMPSALHPVGLEESSSNVLNILKNMGDNLGIVGICGMGGIGKTTLAIEIYNHLQPNFTNSRCFLKDVKDFKGSGVQDLRKTIVKQLIHDDPGEEEIILDDHYFGRLQKQKVLLVIDDIDERKQFDELLPRLQGLAPESRVIITSRDKNILNNIMQDIPNHALYEVCPLNSVDSLNLFIWCAFRTNTLDSIDAKFHGFVSDIASACSGLPLALEVMGGFLCDKKNLPKDEMCWRKAVVALRSNENIISKLQISYDGLRNDADKQLFLDIACFFLGHSEKLAMVIWESNDPHGTPSWSLNRLMDKHLVKLKDGLLSMHDLLRDMGHNIVKKMASGKLEKQTYLWNPLEAAQILQKNKGSNEILALSIAKLCKQPNATCEAQRYASMKELRYLLLDGCHVNGNFSGWSRELKWLHWRRSYRKSLPSSLKLPNLAVLDLSYSQSLTRVWPLYFELQFPCEELQLMILKYCIMLKELPKHINKLLMLKALNVEGCRSLKSLPDSLGDLKELDYLNLSKCWELETLPNNIVNLPKIRVILLGECESLKKLPMEFGKLKSLVKFNAFCSGLLELPDSFSGLCNLEQLDLSCCYQLENLPPSISKLQKLKVLKIFRSIALKELPEDFGQLSSLSEVDFHGCRRLRSLPQSFNLLWSKLSKIDFSECIELHRWYLSSRGMPSI